MAQCKSELRSFHLFAGAGGGILADLLLGHKVVGACEIEEYPRKVLLQRQRDGILPEFPIWDDIKTLDGTDWKGRVDLVCGGFPCQDISSAGKGAGISGSRSGLWAEMARIVSEIQPRYVFVENSPMLTHRGLGVVLGGLATLGYDAKWGVISCKDAGGVHLRERIWILATNPKELYCNGRTNNYKHSGTQAPEYGSRLGSSLFADNLQKRKQGCGTKEIYRFSGFPWGEDVRGVEDLQRRSDLPQPLICRKSHDVPRYVDIIAAIGNAQVPRVAALAFTILKQRLTN